MEYLLQFFIAAFATFGFTLYFSCPKNAIYFSSSLSGLSWVIYKFVVTSSNNYFLAGFTSAFVLGLLGEFLAKALKKPATIFILPGLIPMVPGAGIYYSMYYLIEQDTYNFQIQATNSFFIASSLAIGIVAASALKSAIFILLKKRVK